ncbi:MAG: transcription antitermination factor NusB [Bacteroidetes bacterium]|nr:transcription antitermination factor NusB [Bacteroidota bacterium]
MSNRHLSRSIVMQSLFELEFNEERDKPARPVGGELDAILEKNIREFAPGLEDKSFLENLAKGVLKKKKAIDKIIEKAAPEWPIKHIARVDRNVLRIGLYELLFGDRKQVPPKVAINEAIELAKTFGGDTSGKFINGVLGTVYREIGEPGKDDTAKKKQVIDPSKLPKDELGGAVVCRKDGDEIFFGMVHDVFDYWTLSKSRLKEGEKVEDTALRAIKEELGLTKLTLGSKLGTNEYIASNPERGPIRRQVTYFLIETPEEKLVLGESGGLDDANWFTLDQTKELKIYDDIKPLLQKAYEKLS